MLQRPSTSEVLSCLPQPGLGFLGMRNYCSTLAALLLSNFLSRNIGWDFADICDSLA